MQIVIKIKPLVVTVFLFLLWKFAYLDVILLRFSKNPSFVKTYELFYFSFLLVASFLIQGKLARLKTLRWVILSTALGYGASLGCIFFTWIVMADKISDVASWFTTGFGFMDTLLYYLVIPLPTLGWLITPFAFFLLTIDPRQSRAESST